LLSSLPVILLGVGTAAGTELIANGSFEDPPDIGWRYSVWGNFSDTSNCKLVWRHDLDPDRDFEILVHKMLHQGARLAQLVELPTLDAVFSLNCRLTSKTERESLFAAAAVCLEYIDRHDSVLGETRIYSATSGCDWTTSASLHLIRAPDSLNWHRYSLNLGEELAHVPAVDPDSVRYVRVSLLSFVLDNC
jgi:hypothetical protein